MELFSLLSSLPYLKLYETPVISFAKFLEYCANNIRGERMVLLEELSILPGQGMKSSASVGSDYDASCSEFAKRIRKILPEKALICQYAIWETALRNSIAAIRASKWRGGEMGAGARPDAVYESEAERTAQAAYSASNPLERERILDEARWNKLDDLARINHHHAFTYDSVCAYGLKLLIAEKWVSRTKEAAIPNLDKAVTNVQTPAAQE